MNSISGFLRLRAAERRLLVNTLIIVAGIRIGLSIMSYPRFERLLTRFKTSTRAPRAVMARPSIEELIWTVCVASAYVPRATCLTQALAGHMLLERFGYPSIVRVGVIKGGSEKNAFHAHAWLESNGAVVIGQSEELYVPLTALSVTGD